jgi:hypothetical protein
MATVSEGRGKNFNSLAELQIIFNIDVKAGNTLLQQSLALSQSPEFSHLLARTVVKKKLAP